MLGKLAQSYFTSSKPNTHDNAKRTVRIEKVEGGRLAPQNEHSSTPNVAFLGCFL